MSFISILVVLGFVLSLFFPGLSAAVSNSANRCFSSAQPSPAVVSDPETAAEREERKLMEHPQYVRLSKDEEQFKMDRDACLEMEKERREAELEDEKEHRAAGVRKDKEARAAVAKQEKTRRAAEVAKEQESKRRHLAALADIKQSADVELSDLANRKANFLKRGDVLQRLIKPATSASTKRLARRAKQPSTPMRLGRRRTMVTLVA